LHGDSRKHRDRRTSAVDRSAAAGFDPTGAMSQPRHIYASTRRRRRPLWPAALGAATLLGGLAVVAAELLRGLG
jgi:hypothetical protein